LDRNIRKYKEFIKIRALIQREGSRLPVLPHRVVAQDSGDRPLTMNQRSVVLAVIVVVVIVYLAAFSDVSTPKPTPPVKPYKPIKPLPIDNDPPQTKPEESSSASEPTQTTPPNPRSPRIDILDPSEEDKDTTADWDDDDGNLRYVSIMH
jgi:hypothetical protein